MLTTMLAVVLGAQHSPHAAAALVGSLIYGGCWLAFRRGWEPARQVVVITLTLLLVVAVREPYLSQRPPMALLVPPVVALMLTSSRWIVASALLGLLGLALRSGFRSPLLEPLELAVFAMLVSGLVLARRTVDATMTSLARKAREAEQAREQAERAAREAMAERDHAAKLEAALWHMQRLESIGRLAGGVAHDFNNLLTVIGASAAMAERAIASGSSATTDLQEVHRAVARAAELTKQLLAFARKQVLVKRDVDLNQLVTNMERMLGRVLGSGITLKATICAESLRAQADVAQLEQVLVNLVLNARDAVDDARGRIEIVLGRAGPGPREDLEGLPPGDYACIEVRDNGSGMSQAVQARLFEPFFTTKAPGRGTGLGLATCFGIVRQHDGMIRVDSQEGRGTSMRVLLPLASPAERLATSGVVPVAPERHRVLVVEDEPQVRAIAMRALIAAGFAVEQAPNGARGLELLRSAEPCFDVIVTDVVMPELGGVEMARVARQLQPHVGLVFMSGMPEAVDGAHRDFAGAAFLNKPFSPQILVEAVRERVTRPAALQRHA